MSKGWGCCWGGGFGFPEEAMGEQQIYISLKVNCNCRVGFDFLLLLVVRKGKWILEGEMGIGNQGICREWDLNRVNEQR